MNGANGRVVVKWRVDECGDLRFGECDEWVSCGECWFGDSCSFVGLLIMVYN